MAGLLDIFSGMDKATAMGLLQAGAQMMQSGAPSATPNNFLGVVGGGMNGFLNGYGAQSKEEKEAQDKAQEMALKNRLADATINKDNATAGYYQNGGSGADPYWTIVSTANGLAKFNARTGELIPITDSNGKPIIKASDSPDVAFNLNNAKNAADVKMVTQRDGRVVPMQNKDAIPGMLSQGASNNFDLKNPNGIDYASIAEKLLPRVIQVESGGDSNAVSSKGAQGITQIMPATGANPGYGIKPLQNNSDEERMRFTKDYLTTSLGIFNGDVEKAIASYNQGINGVQQNGIDKSYVNKVLGATDTNPFIAKNNPITTNAVNGVKMAVENGTDPHDAIHQGVKMLDDAKSNLQAVRSQLTQQQPSFQLGQSTADKLAAETAAKQQQDLNSANIKLASIQPTKIQEAQGDLSANKIKDVSSADKTMQSVDDAMKYLYKDGNAIFDKNGDLVPPSDPVILGNSPVDRFHMIGHQNGYHNDKASNLIGVQRAAKTLVTDILGGKLGAGVSNSDVQFLQSKVGILDSLQDPVDVYRAVNDIKKRAEKIKSNSAQPLNNQMASQPHIDNILEKYK